MFRSRPSELTKSTLTHRVARQLVRPADVGLHLIRHLQPRIDPLPNSGNAPVPTTWFWLAMLLSGWPTVKKLPSGFRMPVGMFDVEDLAEALAARVGRREQHVRVGVADVGVDAPPAADDVLAVAAHVEHARRCAAGSCSCLPAASRPKFSRPPMPGSSPAAPAACIATKFGFFDWSNW